MKNPLLIVGVVVVIVGAVAVAIVSSKDSSPATKNTDSSSQNQQKAADAVDTKTVTVKDFKYGPEAIKVKVGTTVTWTNTDGVDHTVTSDDDSAIKFDSGDFGKGETFSFTFDKAGTFNYHCTPHPYMLGTVIVTE